MVEVSRENYYGKKPLWQWILIYLVIGGVVYGAMYYFFFAKKDGYTYPGSTNQTSPMYNYSK